MKSILLVKQGIGIGGSETLTLRMANWFVANEIEVYLLTENRKENSLNNLDSRVKKIISDKSFLALSNKKNASAVIQKYHLKNVDVIFGYGPLEFVVSLSLGRIIKDVKILIGVYHSLAYKRFNCNKFFLHLTRNLFKNFHHENILFMSEQVLNFHESILDISFKNARIWPLPLNVPDCKKQHERSNVIVSIGNFKGFKTYNLTMIDVVHNLISKGYEIKYEIYGEGYMRNEMEKKIRKLNLEDVIFLKGQIPYENYQKTARRGFVFVGVGTAVLEAASFGVPSVTAVSFSDQPISYGYVHQLPGFNVGTPIEGYPYQYLEPLIEHLLLADSKKYDEIRKDGYDFVNKNYHINKLMHEFINMTENALQGLPNRHNKRDLILINFASLIDIMKIKIRNTLKNQF